MRGRSSGKTQLSMPLTPAARSLRRRAAHQSKDLEEAVLHTQNRLVNSEDQARYTSLCSRISSVCSPACILTLPMRTSVSSELAQASWTLMELFEMDRYQLQRAAAMVILSDIIANAQ